MDGRFACSGCFIYVLAVSTYTGCRRYVEIKDTVCILNRNETIDVTLRGVLNSER